MAGILDKKSRNLDYILTRSGKKQLSEGRLKFKYYTLSDKSIVYSSVFNNQTKNNISTSEYHYLPFEIETHSSELNPELYLDETITTTNREEGFFFNISPINNTLGESLIKEEILYNKKETDEQNIVFLKKEFFTSKKINLLNLSLYPTVVNNEINAKKLNNVSGDERLFDKLRYKKLSPINIQREEKQIFTISSGLSYFFKKFLSKKDLNFSLNKSFAGLEIIKELEENKSLFRHVYEIKKDMSRIQDTFLFQLFEKTGNTSLEKLHFIDMGSFYDERLNRNKKIYLVGKFLRKIKKSENINKENYTKKISIDEDYSFINIFTMVIE